MSDTTKPSKISAEKKKDVVLFSKDQLMVSEKYAGRRDLLNALLVDDKSYSIDETDTAIERYTKGAVK